MVKVPVATGAEDILKYSKMQRILMFNFNIQMGWFLFEFLLNSLVTHQMLCVILCVLQEKGRKWTAELVEGGKRETEGEEEGKNE